MIEDKKAYTEIEKTFNDKFNTLIAPLMRRFDSDRKYILNTNIAIVVICFLVAAMLYFVFINDVECLIGLALFSIIAALCICATRAKSFENKIKSKIMPEFCKCFGSLKWLNGSYNNSRIFTSSDIVGQFDNYSIDDVFSATYKDIPFDIVEVRFIRESYDSKGRKHSYTFFKGVVVVVPMDKKFSCHTIVRDEKFSLNLFGGFSKRKEIKLEDPIFQKNYKVYSDDEVEARYLLTTAFMERLNNIGKVFRANKIHCAFYNQKLLIALETGRDMFSLCSLLKPLDDSAQFYSLFNEVLSIYKLVDYFKLDKKIGL